MAELLRDNPVSNFSAGFFYPFRGARLLLRYPSLLRYVVIPFIINALVFSGALYLGYAFFTGTVLPMVPAGDAWYWAILTYLLMAVALVVTAVIVFFSFTVVGNLIASPFNDLLSERAEQRLAGRLKEEPFSLRQFWRDARRVLIEEVKKMSIFVLLMLLLLPLNLLPGVGQAIYSVLATLVTLFFLVVEYLGYIMSRKRLGFARQRQFIRQRLFASLGFGTGVFCMLAIPFLQLLCIPFAVLGATLFYLETAK